jgi:hypothetical protein
LARIDQKEQKWADVGPDHNPAIRPTKRMIGKPREEIVSNKVFHVIFA